MFTLPAAPADLVDAPVAAWSEPVIIDTYLPLDPSLHTAFLDSRVYQGSSGRVFPLPFHERISHRKAPHEWQAIHLENEWVRLMILPELGGRIHVGYDKAAGYDFFYRNNVIKPALVGLTGPWISGGVEFNWPQHHRPATFLPTDVEIEWEPDGSVTVWCSDHDPFARMKGMHGIRLRPGSSVVEARVRLYNRSDETQTFLWWANVAAAVNDDYQSFFPTDVHWIADHARRAIATFPQVEGSYYGVDYPARATDETPDGDRLDWYRNITVPTSYMVLATDQDFFGGYDHGRQAGFVHWADRHVAPGKKQWTWGNAEFGRAWDRNLTDDDGPYVELMAGVYTDNQPDFSFITPGETKTFSQYWYPIQRIGPAQYANLDVAVSFVVTPGASSTVASIGVAATRDLGTVDVTVLRPDGEQLYSHAAAVGPGHPVVELATLVGAWHPSELTIVVRQGARTLARWTPLPDGRSTAPESATEPPAPADIGSNDELHVTAQYLEQYRHATRSPEPYRREALARDSGDARAHVASAAALERRGRFAEAEEHLRAAIARLTRRGPNPADGEAHYRLGVVLVHQGRDAEAAGYLEKALWNSAWRVPAALALARLHCRAGEWERAVARLEAILLLDAQHLQANALLAVVLGLLGRADEASAIAQAQLAYDPLDQWTRHIAGRPLSTDPPTLLDVALEYASAGLDEPALQLLEAAADAARHTALGQVQVAPLAHYHRARILSRRHDTAGAQAALTAALAADGRFCQASRLEDAAALDHALQLAPRDHRAAQLLGNWHYDRGNAHEALELWLLAATTASGTDLSTIERNLGIASYNVLRDPALARTHFEAAMAAAPDDAQLLYEFDQLAKRTGESEASRLHRLEAATRLVEQRDDLTIEYAELLTANGFAARAHDLLGARVFQPWEGGEGQVLAAWEHALCALARTALDTGDAVTAVGIVRHAITPPTSLGEARHPLANDADLYLLLGTAFARSGDDDAAREAWLRAARAVGDFVGMRTRAFGAKTYWSILALRELGERDAAAALTAQLEQHVAELTDEAPGIEFFATSLPSLLIFHEDPQRAHEAELATLRQHLALLAD